MVHLVFQFDTYWPKKRLIRYSMDSYPSPLTPWSRVTGKNSIRTNILVLLHWQQLALITDCSSSIRSSWPGSTSLRRYRTEHVYPHLPRLSAQPESLVFKVSCLPGSAHRYDWREMLQLLRSRNLASPLLKTATSDIYFTQMLGIFAAIGLSHSTKSDSPERLSSLSIGH